MEGVSGAWLTLGGVLSGAVATIVVAVLGYRRFYLEQKRLARALIDKYHDPIAVSAFDLQSRIYNILKNDFLTKYLVNGNADEQRYALTNTLYVVGEFLGWVELLRQDIQFLRLGRRDRSGRFVHDLNKVRAVFLGERPDPTFRLFRGEQRAIGESMTTQRRADRERTCIGYAAFVSRLENPEFSNWFNSLRNDVHRLAEGKASRDRIVDIQHALVDLLDNLDPNYERLPQEERQKA